MSLEHTLNDTLTQAIRDKDQRMADIVRMVKSRITERRTAKGFSGQIDDAAVQDVISSFASRSTSSRGGCPRAWTKTRSAPSCASV